MKRALCGTALVAATADQCCYPTCGSAGCNPEGSYCSQSQSNCEGNCHGHFCPSGPPPTPTPPPGPTPPPPPATEYCPGKDDLAVAYGNPQLVDGGWTISGGAGAATKSAFNLLGGYVEFT